MNQKLEKPKCPLKVSDSLECVSDVYQFYECTGCPEKKPVTVIV